MVTREITVVGSWLPIYTILHRWLDHWQVYPGRGGVGLRCTEEKFRSLREINHLTFKDGKSDLVGEANLGLLN